MFLRVVVVAWYIFPNILESIVIPGAVMFLTLAGTTLYFLRASWGEHMPVRPDEEK
jgi:hypothetical protein